jgi:polyisoprenoid-binding protein YceI
MRWGLHLGTGLCAVLALFPTGNNKELSKNVTSSNAQFRIDSTHTRIWFEADATLGDFKGEAKQFSGWADVPDAETFQGVTGKVEIQVASFKTGIGMRDGHLRGDMQADRFPSIVFELAAATREGAQERATAAGLAATQEMRPVLLNGALTIRDQTRNVEIPALVHLDGDSLRVFGRLPTRFTDFGMKPPSRMLGTTKVKNDIVLAFDALFRRATQP